MLDFVVRIQTGLTSVLQGKTPNIPKHPAQEVILMAVSLLKVYKAHFHLYNLNVIVFIYSTFTMTENPLVTRKLHVLCLLFGIIELGS